MTVGRSGVRLVAVGPGARSAWEQLCEGNPDLAASQTPAWSDCLCSDGRYVDVSRLYETAAGRLVLLPLARRRGLPGPVGLKGSWPSGWAYGALVTPDGTRPEDVAAVVADLRRRAAGRTSIWTPPHPRRNGVWAAGATEDALHHRRAVQVLDLRGGFDAVWATRFSGKVRSACRKASRRGVTVEFASSPALVPVFDQLYRRSVERWARDRREPVAVRRWLASRREPASKLSVMVERLGSRCSVGIAWREGQPIAGIVVVRNGLWATYWRGAMDELFASRTGANELLHRTAVEDAAAQGCRWYDFGHSPSEGVARFKLAFGADAWDQREYRFEPVPLSTATGSVLAATKRSVGHAAAPIRRAGGRSA